MGNPGEEKGKKNAEERERERERERKKGGEKEGKRALEQASTRIERGDSRSWVIIERINGEYLIKNG